MNSRGKGIRGVHLATLLAASCVTHSTPSYFNRWAAPTINYTDSEHPAAKARGRYGRSGKPR